MEHEDLVGLATQGTQVGITVWTAESFERFPVPALVSFRNVIDQFGRNSAVAQELQAPVTDFTRLCSSTHTFYIAAERVPESKRVLVLGGLKTGRKRLFVQDGGPFIQIEPVCVLDFYVHESFQRRGVGFQLFEHFLKAEDLTPASLGYDRPSPKLRGFLKKYYGLTDYVPQNNNYVVFRDFWGTPEGQASLAPARLRGLRYLDRPASAPELTSGRSWSPVLSRHSISRNHFTNDRPPCRADNTQGAENGAAETSMSFVAAGDLSQQVTVLAIGKALTGVPDRVPATSQASSGTGQCPASPPNAPGCTAGHPKQLEAASSTTTAAAPQQKELSARLTVLQQQNAMQRGHVTPPWAVHVPLTAPSGQGRRGQVSLPCQECGPSRHPTTHT